MSEETETLRLAEAAEFLKIHPDTLAERARAGEIPGAKIGRSWVFVRSLLREYVTARCVANQRPIHVRSAATLAERLAAQRAQMTAGRRRAVRP